MCICPFSVSTTYLQYNLGKFIIYLQEMYHVKKKDINRPFKNYKKILQYSFFFFTRHRPCKKKKHLKDIDKENRSLTA